MRIQIPIYMPTTFKFGDCLRALSHGPFLFVLHFVQGHEGLSCPTVRGRRKCAGGFTLIELMCVIAIIGILTSISVPIFSSYRDRAIRFETENELRLLEKEISGFFIYQKEFPDSLDDIGFGNLSDPWGNPYQYLRIDGADIKGKGSFRKDRFLVPINTDYDLYSMGPDGKTLAPLTAKPSRDDIIRANNGAYFGPAYLY